MGGKGQCVPTRVKMKPIKTEAQYWNLELEEHEYLIDGKSSSTTKRNEMEFGRENNNE